MLTMENGRIFWGELELGADFQDSLEALFACRGDNLNDDKLKELIKDLHELTEGLH